MNERNLEGLKIRKSEKKLKKIEALYMKEVKKV
jgi:hypothetical protein